MRSSLWILRPRRVEDDFVWVELTILDLRPFSIKERLYETIV